MADAGPDTILLDLFRTNQVRERLIEASLAGLELPPEDYPFYVLIGAEGPWTPTLLAERMAMPLSTVLFRVGRLEKRGHVERVPNPDDRRSYLISLNADGQQLLQQARPRFRAFAESVETRLGEQRVDTLRGHLGELRDAIEAELTRPEKT
jgi:DNA-binding MarR family transcriptional regulator